MMNLSDFLALCRQGLDREYYDSLKESDLDRAKGTTIRMHGYCDKHDLMDIPDLEIVWKISKKKYLWRVGRRGVRHE